MTAGEGPAVTFDAGAGVRVRAHPNGVVTPLALPDSPGSAARSE